MLSPGDKVLLSISGGADSLALWLLFLRFQHTWKLSLHVFHLNHMMRSEAGADASFVQKLAEEAKISSSILTYDVPAYIAEQGLSAQEGARKVRYQLLEETAEKVGADRIALGHHADDQAETLLMWLLRGAGMEGLTGIPAARGRYIRPLIETRRAELEEYCRKQGLEPRIDISNFSLAYDRNHIRLDLLPYLAARYQPQVVDILARTGQLIADENSVISQLTQDEFSKLAEAQNHEVRMRVQELQSLPLALRRRLLRKAIKEVKGDLQGIEFKHVEDLIDGLSRRERPDRCLPGGVSVFQEYDYLVFASRLKDETPLLRRTALKIPGNTELPSLNTVIEARVVDVGQVSLVSEARKAFVDFEKVTPPLHARSRRRGDAFVPLGMDDFKKLQDFLVDEKVPRRKRDRIPIVESGGGIVWVAGHRLDERFKVTAETRKVLVLELKEVKAGVD